MVIFLFFLGLSAYGTHNGFRGFNRLNQALKGKFWDPFFLKVIKHWYVCKVGDGLGTSIDYVRGLRSRAERSEARVASRPEGATQPVID